MGEYVEVKNLPAPVINALASLNYNKKDIEVVASATVSIHGSGGNGYRSFVTLINLSTGETATHYGSWGGANMFNSMNAVDNDTNSYPLPGNGVAITGRHGGGMPVMARLNVPASMVERMIPSPSVTLGKVYLDALYCHHSIKGGAYRRDELARRNVPMSVIDELVAQGMLKRNRTGAVTITITGKNAVNGYRLSY